MKAFVCVSKGQREADAYHADWREIEAENHNKAKSQYSKEARVEYLDVSCVLKKNFTKIGTY